MAVHMMIRASGSIFLISLTRVNPGHLRHGYIHHDQVSEFPCISPPPPGRWRLQHHFIPGLLKNTGQHQPLTLASSIA